MAIQLYDGNNNPGYNRLIASLPVQGSLLDIPMVANYNQQTQPATLDLNHSHDTTDNDNYLSYLLNSLTLSLLDHLFLDLNPTSKTPPQMINKDGNPAGTGRVQVLLLLVFSRRKTKKNCLICRMCDCFILGSIAIFNYGYFFTVRSQFSFLGIA